MQLERQNQSKERVLIGGIVANTTNEWTGYIGAPHWYIAKSPPHMRYTAVIAWDGFCPANYIMNEFNPMQRKILCKVNCGSVKRP